MYALGGKAAFIIALFYRIDNQMRTGPNAPVLVLTGREIAAYRRRIRCRTVHHRPTVGHFSIAWTNEHNALAAGQDPEDPLLSVSRFATSVQDLVYTTEWQEIVLSLAGQDEKIWEGLLKDIRLRFLLDTEVDLWSAAAVVEVAWFEVDWIELTGVEELLQGELPPPYVEYFRLDGIGLFAAPAFYPIAPGIGGGTMERRSAS